MTSSRTTRQSLPITRLELNKSYVVRSNNDHRNYLPLTLDNGLRVLLVEQADAEKSAAAMAVNVGHFDDPKDREGLAHFLEHLVFLGSTQFPDSGEYQQFMAAKGGSHNAWTGTEHSCFYFDIDHRSFAQGLERFADMLSAPLFSDEAVQKERQAIEAEFSMKLKDDGRRIYQAHKETINPAHPFAKFSVGNLQTLDDRPNQSAQQAVREFYQQQYSASRMTLVMVSPLPLARQAELASQYFMALPSAHEAKAALTIPLYLPEHLGIKLNIQPHKPTHRLVLSFALPDIQPWYRFKLISFLAHLIGDEGPGSLLSHLKHAGLVNALNAGGGIDGSNYKDFTIAFELTETGMSSIDQITEQTFGFLQLLKRQPFPETLFVERQRLCQWSFLYQEPKAAQQLASDLAVNLQHYPVEDYIYGDYRMELPTERLYRQVLSFFTSSNLRMMVIAPEVTVDREARWYQTPYSVQRLDAKWLASLDGQLPPALCKIPNHNPYLVGQLHLLPLHAHQQHPVRVCKTRGLSLWFKADTDFGSPKGHIFVQLSLPNTLKNTRQLALTKLWLELFLDRINEKFYPATTAGLSYNIYAQQHGLTLHSSGLSGNQIALLQDVLIEFENCEFSNSRFLELKAQLIRHWQNQVRNKPISQLFNQLSSLLQPMNPQSEQLADELAHCSVQDFQHFSQQMFQQVHIEGLMLGNWTKPEAKTLELMLSNWLTSREEQIDKLPKQSYHLDGQGPIWLNQPVCHDDHALVIYLPAKDRSPLSMALFMLANHLISPEYFHELRTEQQLGYLVGTGYVPMNLKPGIAFYIQSPKTSPADLYYATLIFYRRFLEELPELSPSEFHEIKLSLQSQLKERDTSLSARAKRVWLAIGQADYECRLSQQIQHELSQLSLETFLEFCYQLLAPDYDALFLATGPAPEHSHMRALNIEQINDLLTLQSDWL